MSNFLSQHPDGEIDISNVAGMDASAVFDSIHPSVVIGAIGTSGGSTYAPVSNVSAVAHVASAGGARGWSKECVQAIKNRPNRMDRYGKVGIPINGPFSYMVLAFVKETSLPILGR